MSNGTVWSFDTFTGYEGMPAVVDSLGCKYWVTGVDGWDGAPTPRVQSDDRPSSDGTNDGQSTQPGKTVTITGTVRAPDVPTLQQAMGALSGQLMSGSRYGTLQAVEAWLTRSFRVRRGADTIVIPSRTVEREATFSFVLYAPDPRRLAAPVTCGTGLPSSIGGLTYPMTFPAPISSTVVSGSCFATNTGTTEGPVLMRVDGPLPAGFTVTHVTSGAQVTLALNIAAGDWLLIDMERHEVLANGQATATRNQFITPTGRGWSKFAPGPNQWAFTAPSGSGQLTVTATPAWQ